MKAHRMGIRWRVILTTLAGTGLVLAAIILLNYHSTRQVVLRSHKSELVLLARNHAAKLSGHMLAVEQKPRGLAQALETLPFVPEQGIYHLLFRFMDGPPPAYGMAVAFKPGAYQPDLKLFAPYVHIDPSRGHGPGQPQQGRSPMRDRRNAAAPRHSLLRPDGTQNPEPGPAAPPQHASGPRHGAAGNQGPPDIQPQSSSLVRMNLNNPQYNYPVQDWYLIPMLTQKESWTKPYFDEGGGNTLMTTVSVPFRRQGASAGVVTADLSVDILGREVQNMEVGSGGKGWAFLITQSGTFLAEKQSENVMRESIFSLAEQNDHQELRELGRRMIKGESGITRIPNWHRTGHVWVAYAPVQGPGWSFGAVIPEDVIMEPVRQLALRSLFYALAGMAALTAVVFLLGRSFTKPLERVAQSARQLAKGDLSTKVSGIRPGDELGDLAQSFNTMVDDLNQYVDKLTKTTATKERIEKELELARQIQQSILPRLYPAFPDRPEFDLFGVTRPAREVGGDFYDFFMLDQDNLCLVVGDVSGKGVPAAFFMTIARTLIKNAGTHHQNPVNILNEANAQVVEDNPMFMFVTVFCAVYHIPSGIMRFARAGHPPPLLRRAGGEVSPLPKVEGMVMGVEEDMGLELGEVVMQPDDMVLVFTDGLDEAHNAEQEMFGMQRAADWLKGAQTDATKHMIEDLIRHHQDYTGPVEQFDDLTLLMMRRMI